MVTKDTDTPFIHAPDELDDDVRNGLTCFLDGTRQCGADCMAYTTFSESNSLPQPQGHCLLLANAERGGKHLVIIAKLLNDVITRSKREADDRKREAQKPFDQAAPVFNPPKVGP